MAVQAGPGHQSYGLGHLRPAEPRGDEAVGRSHPWVVYSVQRLEDRLPMLDEDEWAEHPCQNISEQRSVADRLGCDLQRGGVHHLRHFHAGSLRTQRPSPQSRSAAHRPWRPKWVASVPPAPLPASARRRGRERSAGQAAVAARLLKAVAWCVCLKSDVNSVMKESCRCWRGQPRRRGAEQGCVQWLVVGE
jgi:hypothetical protein